MERLTRPLTNNEILKAKPQEKDFTLHDGDGLFMLVKTSVRSFGVLLPAARKQQSYKSQPRFLPCPYARCRTPNA